MKLFNIGIPELIFILVIALIVLGPDGIVKTARTLGRTIRKIIRSPIWSMMLDTQRELREMPTKLVREAGLEEDLAELRKTSQEVKRASASIAKDSQLGDLPRISPLLNQPASQKNATPTDSQAAAEDTALPQPDTTDVPPASMDDSSTAPVEPSDPRNNQQK